MEINEFGEKEINWWKPDRRTMDVLFLLSMSMLLLFVLFVCLFGFFLFFLFFLEGGGGGICKDMKDLFFLYL